MGGVYKVGRKTTYGSKTVHAFVAGKNSREDSFGCSGVGIAAERMRSRSRSGSVKKRKRMKE
jgi:hypothetical protein